MSDKIIHTISDKSRLIENDLVMALNLYDQEDRFEVFETAKRIRDNSIGKNIYLRGLVEYSNVCGKNCYYCGIRAGNSEVSRYVMSDEDVISCARYALDHNYGSLVIQSGEIIRDGFADRMTSLLTRIHQETGHKLAITLSCGEQTKEVYQRWFDAGASRYLLRIETTNKKIFSAIHPNNNHHAYENRIKSLAYLRDTGYQVGTGVMIGLPGQTTADLAKDLIFFRDLDVDMVGMGPYVEHCQTPMFGNDEVLIRTEHRYNLSLLMMSLLRIIMPTINIASTTALDALNPQGRIDALKYASNVLMPNLTPLKYTENYKLYNNKPDSLHSDELVETIQKRLFPQDMKIGFGQAGTSKHFSLRKVQKES